MPEAAEMTDASSKARRLPKRLLRVWAWIAGALAFFTPWAVLGVSPKPPAGTAAPAAGRPVILIRKITRRVIIQAAPKSQPIRYVYASGSSGSSSSAPVTSSGGSAPPP
jgi:hypothetical protein